MNLQEHAAEHKHLFEHKREFLSKQSGPAIEEQTDIPKKIKKDNQGTNQTKHLNYETVLHYTRIHYTTLSE